MVKHIIVWKLKDEYTAEEKAKIAAEIKTGLEGLAGRIPGLVEIKVHTNGLPSSSCELMLDSTFETFQDLKAYGKNPLHVAVADGKVRPNICVRSCFDYEL